MAQVSAQTCLICDENNGAYYCYECQHAYCTVCRNRHDKIPALSGHTTVDVNTINISIVNKINLCGTHDKEIQFYCTDCSNLICSNCVTSTHKSHSLSDISDVVLEERKLAEENFQELKLKLETISSLQENIRSKQVQKLHVESKTCIGHIESVWKDLQSFLEAEGKMKTTEVVDNEETENNNFETFLKNTDEVQKQYEHILSELENLLLEKHDVTFYSGYKSIQIDIQTLVSIPEEPPFARVPSFEDEFLYREVIEHMVLMMDNRNVESKDDELKTLSEYYKSLKDEEETKQATLTSAINQKDAEIKQLSDNIECFKKDIEKKNDELQKQTQEIEYWKKVSLHWQMYAQPHHRPVNQGRGRMISQTRFRQAFQE